MSAIVFPTDPSPADGQIETIAGQTWKFRADIPAWEKVSAALYAVTGLIAEGDNVTFEGEGTLGDPLVIHATAGGSAAIRRVGTNGDLISGRLPLLSTDEILVFPTGLTGSPTQVLVNTAVMVGAKIINLTSVSLTITDATTTYGTIPAGQTAIVVDGTDDDWKFAIGHPTVTARIDGQPDFYVDSTTVTLSTTLTADNCNNATGRVIRYNNTEPNDFFTTAGMPTGMTWVVEQYSTGQVTIEGGVGCTIVAEEDKFKTAGIHSRIYVEHRGGDEFIVIGGTD